jgi:nucleoside-diphosphate-sugar epimerase
MRFDLAVNIMTLRAVGKRDLRHGWRPAMAPFIHVDDVVDVLAHVLEADADIVSGDIFNVGDERMNHRIYQLAKFVLDVIPNVTVHNIPDDPDKRTYNLRFSKIRQRLGFIAKKAVHQGIVEIKEAFDHGLLNGDYPTCYTLQRYNSLIEWQERIDGLMLEGKVM